MVCRQLLLLVRNMSWPKKSGPGRAETAFPEKARVQGVSPGPLLCGFLQPAPGGAWDRLLETPRDHSAKRVAADPSAAT